jgi:dihydroneopterin aldolase
MSQGRDEINLEGMVFFGRHGVNPEETTLGQRFGADLSVFLDLSKAGGTDDVADTVSYASLYKIVRAEVEGEPSKLLEHLAVRIIRKVLEHDKRIVAARLRVTKLNPPLKGSTSGQAAVVIERDQDWLAKESE